MTQNYYIKNMVCDRCIKVLDIELKAKNIEVLTIELGRIEVKNPNAQTIHQISKILQENGFELIDTAETKITEEVKHFLIGLLEQLPLEIDGNLSDVISNVMNQDYSKTSKIFSFTEGITIEKYFIKLKIEKVKELIQIDEMNFTEISQLLDYSHVNHLSRQFKSHTGLSLTQYKSEHKNFRNSLDQIV